MQIDLPPSWHDALAPELAQPYFAKLAAFVDAERQKHTVFPPESDVFNALKLTPLDRVRVLILGQDPYHDDGQAHGLAFSVQPGENRRRRSSTSSASCATTSAAACPTTATWCPGPSRAYCCSTPS